MRVRGSSLTLITWSIWRVELTLASDTCLQVQLTNNHLKVQSYNISDRRGIRSNMFDRRRIRYTMVDPV